MLSTKVGRLLVPSGYPEGTMDDEGFAVPADLARGSTTSAATASAARSTRASSDSGSTASTSPTSTIPTTTGRRRIAEAIPALIELRDEGVVGAVGAGMNQSAMPAEFVRRHDVDVIMLAGRYTLLEQGALDDLLPLAVDRGVGIVAAAVYNSGLLSRPRPAADAHYDYGPAPEAMIARANAIADTCEEFGITLPEAAIAYPLRHPAVVSVVVGMRTADQVVGTAERYEARLPQDFWRVLSERGLTRDA